MRRDRESMTRRGFLATSAAAGAAAVIAPSPVSAEAATGIPRTVLGKTGETVTILSAGTAMPVNPRIMEALLTQGITYIDTAQSYMRGRSEEAIGSYLEKTGRREECFVVTKCWSHDVDAFTSKLDGSLESLPRAPPMRCAVAMG